MARFAGSVAASEFADRYGLALFFALAYLFSWSVWSLEGRVGNGGLVVWLGSVGPALAAVLVAALSRGRQGLEVLLSRLFVWRVGVKWYLIALFLVPVVGLGIAAAYVLTGNLTADLPGADAWRDTLGLQLVGIGSAVALGTLISVGEELGWRGYALPRLQERVHPLASSSIIGLLWGVWHFNGLLGGQAEAVSLQNALFFLLGTVSASVIYTWLFNNTRGSVLIACLFHAVYDVTVVWVLAVLPLPSSANRVGMLGLAGIALVIVLVAGPRLSYQPQETIWASRPRQDGVEIDG
jgi:membrane protease YdiL (CAAX protease family)